MVILLILAAVIFVIKIPVVINYRGFNLADIMKSYFRIYAQDEIKMTTNKKRKLYRRVNNLLNIFLYLLIATAIVLFIAYSRVLRQDF